MMNIKRTVFISLIAIIGVNTNVFAQKFFGPTEEGKLVEIVEGKTLGNSFTGKKPQYPRKMPTIVTYPLCLYIYSEEEIFPEELFLGPIFLTDFGNEEFLRNGRTKKSQTNFMINSLKKIAPNIYQIKTDSEIFPRKENLPENLKDRIKDKFVIGYEPNKQHKKEGKIERYWYGKISQLDYDAEDIGEWTQEQAIESVNQIMLEGKTTEQLFASIKPQPTIPQEDNGQQIQYVVVQNQSSPIPQENNLGSKIEEKAEIISDVDKNIPYRDINNENTFALIIANEDYNKVAPVNFALRDGQKINEYFKKTLGISKDHIAYLENATLNDMRYELNRLSKISDAYNGEASFIIYYVGHGIPDEKNGNGYLLPVDGYGNDVTTAYSLEELYSQLSSLDAKKIVLFTDACFSGANKSGDILVAARGIAIRSNQNEAKGHLIAFSACQGDETAYSYDEQGHGLLTYYFLKKLKDTAGQTTLGELEEYIVDNVGKTAIVINGKSQTPRVSVSPDLQDSWREQTFFE